MLRDLDVLFRKNNIVYWITGGTLLGAIRHRGLIPWDDDADICILKSSLPTLLSIQKILEKKYNFIFDNDKICSLKKDCTILLTGKKENDLGCDIFIMEPDKDKITYSDIGWKKAENGGKKCSFLTTHLFPLTRVLFGNFYLYAPYNSIMHLNKCYGNDWNSHSMLLFNHRTGKWHSAKKHEMKQHEYFCLTPPCNLEERKF